MRALPAIADRHAPPRAAARLHAGVAAGLGRSKTITRKTT